MTNTKDDVLRHHKENIRKNRMVRPKIWKYTTVVLLVLLLVMIYTGDAPQLGNSNSDTAVQDAVDYLNNELLEGLAVAELVKATEENGLYKLELYIVYANGLEEEFVSYLSKDGKMLFPTAIELEKTTVEIEEDVVTDEDLQAAYEETAGIPTDEEETTEELVEEEAIEELGACQEFCSTEGFDSGTCRETTEDGICTEDETAFGFDECDNFERCCCA
jgi:hypothetical protein